MLASFSTLAWTRGAARRAKDERKRRDVSVVRSLLGLGIIMGRLWLKKLGEKGRRKRG